MDINELKEKVMALPVETQAKAIERDLYRPFGGWVKTPQPELEEMLIIAAVYEKEAWKQHDGKEIGYWSDFVCPRIEAALERAGYSNTDILKLKGMIPNS